MYLSQNDMSNFKPIKTNYESLIKEVCSKTGMPESDFFNYINTPVESIFAPWFHFYHNQLRNHSNYGIAPAAYVFNNKMSFNAAAGKINNYYIISINQGVFMHQAKWFDINKELITQNSDLFAFCSAQPIATNKLIDQIFTHFLFYHEMAHLIQKSDLTFNQMYNESINSNNYSLDNHLFEFDADTFASLYIAQHLVKYTKKHRRLFTKLEDYENLIIVASCSIFLYIQAFKTNDLPLYFSETSHPHPLIRTTCVLRTITKYFSQQLKHELSIELNYKAAISRSLNLMNDVSPMVFGENRFENYGRTLIDNYSELAKYYNVLNDTCQSDKRMAWYKRNRITKKAPNKI